MTDAPYTQPVGTGDTDEKPIKLGGALFTMVEPHPGHEVAYNRWYERDHFYAGCMIGAYTVAGARYVATSQCKAKRYPADSAITPDPAIGSYLALYWILAGHFDDWMRWGTDQVNWLHANGRMFTDRDHIHTLMYELVDERSGVDMPAELALDRAFPGVVATIGELADGTTINEVVDWYAQRPSTGEVVVTFTPKPLFDDAPGDVPRDTVANRFLRLAFVTESPLEVWDDRFAGEGDALAESGLGRLVFASPFLATVPGTDTYTDQLR